MPTNSIKGQQEAATRIFANSTAEYTMLNIVYKLNHDLQEWMQWYKDVYYF